MTNRDDRNNRGMRESGWHDERQEDRQGQGRYGSDMSMYGAREEERESYQRGRAGERTYEQYGQGNQQGEQGYGRVSGGFTENSYQRGLGGTGNYNPGSQSSMGPRSDRDMGNLERSPYGLGSAMRGQGQDMGSSAPMGMGGTSYGVSYGQGSMSGQGYQDQGYQGQGYQGSQSQRAQGQGYQSSMDQGQLGQHYGRGPRNYQRNDERIREDVNEQLTYHHDIDATDIDVVVQGGEVTLMGTVTDRRQKRLAEDVAEQVRGVRDVHNQLRVQQGLMGGMQGSQMQGSTLIAAPTTQGGMQGQGGVQGQLSSQTGSLLSTTAMSGGDTTGLTTAGTTLSSTPEESGAQAGSIQASDRLDTDR